MMVIVVFCENRINLTFGMNPHELDLDTETAMCSLPFGFTERALWVDGFLDQSKKFFCNSR
eukprot:m.42391 g.42391  ORF g.42391 m.42391 type:complete len:61 (+) comp10683_c1_seq1:340-522(+)